MVAMREMRMVSGCFVIAHLEMLGSFEMVLSSLLMMFSCLLVMTDSFLRHGSDPFAQRLLQNIPEAPEIMGGRAGCHVKKE